MRTVSNTETQVGRELLAVGVDPAMSPMHATDRLVSAKPDL